ncbi:glycosyltransferase [Synechococcus sp. GFB01]|uniref:glycosyltransferase n=1 Tax=Synechococcus sp. GFB01 TaxID=1662190 RepID=UPI00090815BF|nr:glycosyltransferase [Synechococcus sp. GFB01]
MSLHIALIAPLSQPTPPLTYGGVERVVAIHAAELVRLGHRVTLFGAAGSGLPGVRTLPYGPAGIWPGKRQLARLLSLLPRAGRLDVVHSFGRSTALLPWLASPGPRLVQTYACPWPPPPSPGWIGSLAAACPTPCPPPGWRPPSPPPAPGSRWCPTPCPPISTAPVSRRHGPIRARWPSWAASIPARACTTPSTLPWRPECRW